MEACARSDSPRRSEIWAFLRDAGAQLNPPGQKPYRKSNSLLTELIDHGWEDAIIHEVLASGVGINDSVIGPDGRTPLQASVRRGDLNLVKELVAHGAAINAPAGYKHGRTALKQACDDPIINMDLVWFLLENNADVNAKAGAVGGVTALQGVAISGHTNLALLLIDEFNADVNGLPAVQEGRTALEAAADHGRLDLVQILLAKGAKPRATKSGFEDAIYLAEGEGHWAVARLLSEAAV